MSKATSESLDCWAQPDLQARQDNLASRGRPAFLAIPAHQVAEVTRAIPEKMERTGRTDLLDNPDCLASEGRLEKTA